METPSYSPEQEFIKIVYLRYDILRHLYPDITMSTKELLQATGHKKGNFSNKLQDLRDYELVEVLTKKSGTGWPTQHISLTDDGREILQKIIELRNPSKMQDQLPILQNNSIIYRCLEFITETDPNLKRLAADEFQFLSQRYQIPLEPQFFVIFKNIIEDESTNAVLHTLLKSLLNIIKNSDPESISKIDSELGKEILTLNRTSKKERIIKVTEEISAELQELKNRCLLLNQRYLSLLKKGSPQIGEVRALIMKHLTPKEKTELRIELLQYHKKAKPDIKTLIEIELTQLR